MIVISCILIGLRLLFLCFYSAVTSSGQVEFVAAEYTCELVRARNFLGPEGTA